VAQVLQAMDSKQELTALGHHLASLPVDARVGKMLLYAAILGCLDPVSSLRCQSPRLLSDEETQ
jgi:ATP-dependent RNA helicase DHX36